MSAEPVDSSLVQLDNEIAVSKIDNPEMVPGRRDFLKYRELGVTKASEGKIRAQVTSASQDFPKRPAGMCIFVKANSFTF